MQLPINYLLHASLPFTYIPTLQQGEVTNAVLVTTEEIFVHDITFTWAVDGSLTYFTLSDFFLSWSYCQPGDPWHPPTNTPTQDPASARKKRGRVDGEDEEEEDGAEDSPPHKKKRFEPATTPVRSCCAPLHCTATHA